VSRGSGSGGVVIQNGGFLTGWAKKQRSIALSSWESELFAAITVGTRCLGINAELADLGRDRPIVLATDSQSVIDHYRRRGHASGSKHVGLRGLWLQEATTQRTLAMEKVHTSQNPADVCTKALPWEKIRVLCDLAGIHLCLYEDSLRGDPANWSLAALGRASILSGSTEEPGRN